MKTLHFFIIKNFLKLKGYEYNEETKCFETCRYNTNEIFGRLKYHKKFDTADYSNFNDMKIESALRLVVNNSYVNKNWSQGDLLNDYLKVRKLNEIENKDEFIFEGIQEYAKHKNKKAIKIPKIKVTKQKDIKIYQPKIKVLIKEDIKPYKSKLKFYKKQIEQQIENNEFIFIF